MRIKRPTAALAAIVFLCWGHAVVPGAFPDCNDNGLDDFDETATTFTAMEIGPGGLWLADLDGDGDLDILDDNPMSWRENLDGAGTFAPTIVIDDVSGQVAAGDFDSDGDMDVARRGSFLDPFQTSFNAIYVYESLGTGAFGSPEVAFSMVNDGGCPSAWWGRRLETGDRDSDGDVDVFSAGLSCSVGAVLTARNDGTGEGWGESFYYNGLSDQPALGDLDGDGDNDLMVPDTYFGALQWSEGPTDTPGHWLWTAAPTPVVRLADLDGDGDTDVVGLRDIVVFDDIKLYENASGRGNLVATQTIAPIGNWQNKRLLVGDLNGDGDTDILWSSHWSANAFGSFGPPQPFPAGGGITDVGDIDSDGDLDLLATGRWYRNDGDDCNGNRVPDECEPDCDGNGITDACEIRVGAAVDCDGNGVPDTCDTGCPAGTCDQDGDGCQDDVDPAPDDGVICGDTDADGCDDCSNGIFDPLRDGANGDSDGVCDATDCDPVNNEAWGEPRAATDLRLGRESTTATLLWQRPDSTGGIFPRYDVLRSTSPADFSSTATTVCLETDEDDLGASDEVTPAPGSVAHYLVRVENDCPGGAGSMGTDSGGAPRSGVACETIPTGQGLVINEVDYAAGANEQFVEIYNPSDATVDLSSLTLIFVDFTGSEYMRADLVSAGVLPSGGYLVAAEPSVVVDPEALVLPLPDDISTGGGFRAAGIALFDLGSISLVDALSYQGAITAATFDGVPGTWSLVEGTPTPWADNSSEEGVMVRHPDGLDTDDAASDWGVSGPPQGSATPGSSNAVPW